MALREDRWNLGRHTRRGPARIVLTPVLMFLFAYYGTLILQQGVRYLAARLAGLTATTFYWGLGQTLSYGEFMGQRVGLRQQWWWGPSVFAPATPGSNLHLLLSAVGPAIGIGLVILLLLDRRHRRSQFNNILLAAAVAATATTMAIVALTH